MITFIFSYWSVVHGYDIHRFTVVFGITYSSVPSTQYPSLTLLSKTRRFPKITEMFHWFSKTAPYVLTTNGNCKRCLWLHEFVGWILLMCVKDKSARSFAEFARPQHIMTFCLLVSLSAHIIMSKNSPPPSSFFQRGGGGGKLRKRWLTNQRIRIDVYWSMLQKGVLDPRLFLNTCDRKLECLVVTRSDSSGHVRRLLSKFELRARQFQVVGFPRRFFLPVRKFSRMFYKYM